MEGSCKQCNLFVQRKIRYLYLLVLKINKYQLDRHLPSFLSSPLLSSHSYLLVLKSRDIFNNNII